MIENDATLARASDIRRRLYLKFHATFRKEHIPADAALIDGLLDDAMHQVENLLDELEGWRRHEHG